MADYPSPFAQTAEYPSPFAGESNEYPSPFQLVESPEIYQPEHQEWIGPAPAANIMDVPGGMDYLRLKDENAASRMGFIESITEWGLKHIPFYGDFNEAANLKRISGIVSAIKEEKHVSDEDLVRLNTWMQEEQRMQNASFGGKVSEVLKNQVKFWTELGSIALATATVVGDEALAIKLIGGKAAKKIEKDLLFRGLKGVTKRVVRTQMVQAAMRGSMEKAMIGTMGKYVGNILKGQVGKRSIDLFSKGTLAMINGGVKGTMLAVANPGMATRSIAQKKLENMIRYGDEDKTNAVAYGFADSVIEHWSEVMGADLGRAAGAAIKSTGAKNLATKILGAKVTGFFANKGLKVNQAGAIMRNMGINNVWEEFMEERFGGFMRGLHGIEGDDKGLFNPIQAIDKMIPTMEQAGVEMVAFSIPGLAGNAASFATRQIVTGTEFGEAMSNMRAVGEQVGKASDSDAETYEQLRVPMFDKIKEAAMFGIKKKDGNILVRTLDNLLFGPSNILESLHRMQATKMIGLYQTVYENELGKKTDEESMKAAEQKADQALGNMMALFRESQTRGIMDAERAAKFEKYVDSGQFVKETADTGEGWDAYYYISPDAEFTEEFVQDMITEGMMPIVLDLETNDASMLAQTRLHIINADTLNIPRAVLEGKQSAPQGPQREFVERRRGTEEEEAHKTRVLQARAEKNKRGDGPVDLSKTNDETIADIDARSIEDEAERKFVEEEKVKASRRLVDSLNQNDLLLLYENDEPWFVLNTTGTHIELQREGTEDQEGAETLFLSKDEFAEYFNRDSDGVIFAEIDQRSVAEGEVNRDAPRPIITGQNMQEKMMAVVRYFAPRHGQRSLVELVHENPNVINLALTKYESLRLLVQAYARMDDLNRTFEEGDLVEHDSAPGVVFQVVDVNGDEITVRTNSRLIPDDLVFNTEDLYKHMSSDTFLLGAVMAKGTPAQIERNFKGHPVPRKGIMPFIDKGTYEENIYLVRVDGMVDDAGNRYMSIDGTPAGYVMEAFESGIRIHNGIMGRNAFDIGTEGNMLIDDVVKSIGEMMTKLQQSQAGEKSTILKNQHFALGRIHANLTISDDVERMRNRFEFFVQYYMYNRLGIQQYDNTIPLENYLEIKSIEKTNQTDKILGYVDNYMMRNVGRPVVEAAAAIGGTTASTGIKLEARIETPEEVEDDIPFEFDEGETPDEQEGPSQAAEAPKVGKPAPSTDKKPKQPEGVPEAELGNPRLLLPEEMADQTKSELETSLYTMSSKDLYQILSQLQVPGRSKLKGKEQFVDKILSITPDVSEEAELLADEELIEQSAVSPEALETMRASVVTQPKKTDVFDGDSVVKMEKAMKKGRINPAFFNAVSQQIARDKVEGADPSPAVDLDTTPEAKEHIENLHEPDSSEDSHMISFMGREQDKEWIDDEIGIFVNDLQKHLAWNFKARDVIHQMDMQTGGRGLETLYTYANKKRTGKLRMPHVGLDTISEGTENLIDYIVSGQAAREGAFPEYMTRQYQSAIAIMSNNVKFPSTIKPVMRDGSIKNWKQIRRGRGPMFYGMNMSKSGALEIKNISNVAYMFPNVSLQTDRSMHYTGPDGNQYPLTRVRSMGLDTVIQEFGEEYRVVLGLKELAWNEEGTWNFVKSNGSYIMPADFTGKIIDKIIEHEIAEAVSNGEETYWHPIGKFGEKEDLIMVRMPLYNSREMPVKVGEYISEYEDFASEFPGRRKASLMASDTKIRELMKHPKKNRHKITFILNQTEIGKKFFGSFGVFADSNDMSKRLNQVFTPGLAVEGKDMQFKIAVVNDDKGEMFRQHGMPLIDGFGVFDPEVVGPYLASKLGDLVYDAERVHILKAFFAYRNNNDFISQKPNLISLDVIREYTTAENADPQVYEYFAPIIKMFDDSREEFKKSGNLDDRLGVVTGTSSLKVNGVDGSTDLGISEIWDDNGAALSNPDIVLEQFDGAKNRFYYSQDFNFENLIRERFGLSQPDTLRLLLDPAHRDAMMNLENQILSAQSAGYNIEWLHSALDTTDPDRDDIAKHGTLASEIRLGIPAEQILSIGFERKSAQAVAAAHLDEISKLSLPRFMNSVLAVGESEAKRMLFRNYSDTTYAPAGSEVNIDNGTYTLELTEELEKKLLSDNPDRQAIDQLKKERPWMFNLDMGTGKLSDMINRERIVERDGKKYLMGQPYLSIRTPSSYDSFVTASYITGRIGDGKASIAMSNGHLMLIKSEDADGDLMMGITLLGEQDGNGNVIYRLDGNSKNAMTNRLVLMWWQASLIRNEAKDYSKFTPADPNFMQSHENYRDKFKRSTKQYMHPWNTLEGQDDAYRINTVGKKALGIIARTTHGARAAINYGMGLTKDIRITDNFRIRATDSIAKEFAADKLNVVKHDNMFMNNFITMTVDDTKEQQAAIYGIDQHTAPFIGVFTMGAIAVPQSEWVDYISKMFSFFNSDLIRNYYIPYKESGLYRSEEDLFEALSNVISARDLKTLEDLTRAQKELFNLSTLVTMKHKLPKTQYLYELSDPDEMTWRMFDTGSMFMTKAEQDTARELGIPVPNDYIPFLQNSIERYKKLGPVFENDMASTETFKQIKDLVFNKVKGRVDQDRSDDYRDYVAANDLENMARSILIMESVLGDRTYQIKSTKKKQGIETRITKAIKRLPKSNLWRRIITSTRGGETIIRLSQFDSQVDPNGNDMDLIHSEFDKLGETLQDDIVVYLAHKFGSNASTRGGSWLRYVGPQTRARIYPKIFQQALRWKNGQLTPGEIEAIADHIASNVVPYRSESISEEDVDEYVPWKARSADDKSAWEDRSQHTDLTIVEEMPSEWNGIPVVNRSGLGSAARTDRENNRILINEKLVKKKFKDKAWRLSRVKGVTPLNDSHFRTYADWRDFVLEHEYQYMISPRQDGEGKNDPGGNAAYENRMNQQALAALEEARISEGGVSINLPDTLEVVQSKKSYAGRTIENAQDTDATIAIAITYNTAGEKQTKRAAGDKYIRVPWTTIGDDPSASGEFATQDSFDAAVLRTVKELNRLNATSVNIAGNGLYTFARRDADPEGLQEGELQGTIDQTVFDFLEAVVNHPDLVRPINRIQSGGQTGVDEAGIYAGVSLGIPTKIIAPNQWAFRDETGEDIFGDKAAFLQRFVIDLGDGGISASISFPDREVAYRPPMLGESSPLREMGIQDSETQASYAVSFISNEIMKRTNLVLGDDQFYEAFWKESKEKATRIAIDTRLALNLEAAVGLTRANRAITRGRRADGEYVLSAKDEGIVAWDVFDPVSIDPSVAVNTYTNKADADRRVNELNKGRPEHTKEDEKLADEVLMALARWKEVRMKDQKRVIDGNATMRIPVSTERVRMTAPEMIEYARESVANNPNQEEYTDEQAAVIYGIFRGLKDDKKKFEQTAAFTLAPTKEKMQKYIEGELEGVSDGVHYTVNKLTYHDRTVEQIMEEWNAKHPDKPFGRYISETKDSIQATPGSLLNRLKEMYDNALANETEYVDPYLSRTIEQGEKDPYIKYRQHYVFHDMEPGTTEDESLNEEFQSYMDISERPISMGRRKYGTYYAAMIEAGMQPKWLRASDQFRSRSKNVWAKATQKAMFTQFLLSKDVSGEPRMLIYSDLSSPALKYHDNSMLLSDDAMSIAARHWLDYLNGEKVRAKQKPTFVQENKNGRVEMNRLIDELKPDKNMGYKRIDFEKSKTGLRRRGFKNISAIYVKEGTREEKILDRVINPSPNMGWLYNKLIEINDMSKELGLGFSAFHYLALLESYIAMFGLGLRNPAYLLNLPDAWSGLRSMHQHMLLDPEMFAKWTRAGMQIDVGPPDFSMKPLSRVIDAIRDTNLPVLKQGADVIDKLRQVNSNWLWGFWLPSMKMYTAEFMFNEVRYVRPQDYAYENVSDHQLRRDISNGVNNMFGGQDWDSMIWATPRARSILKLLLFAPDWTLSAINIAASPAGISSGQVRGVSPIEIQWARQKYWPAMASIVMFAIPNAMQFAIYAWSKAIGKGDPDDKPFVWQNEEEKASGPFGIPGMGHIDITPMARLLPGYRGDPTGERRVYLRFAKQATEIFEGWLEKPVGTLMGKSSSVVKLAWEQITGQNTYGWDLDFKELGPEGFLRGETKGVWGGRVSYIGKKFVPMSILSWLEGRPSTFVAPASRGMSKSLAQKKMAQILYAYADNRTWDIIKDNNQYKQNLNTLFPELLDAVERNGYDPIETFKGAKRHVLSELYNEFFNALNKGQDIKLEKVARAIVRVHGTIDTMQKSMELKYKTVTKEFTPELQERASLAFQSL